MKLVANEIFGVFEKYKAGQCSYDRALEDASNIIKKHADERQIVGYIRSGTLKRVLFEVLKTKKPTEDKTYVFDCKIHQNEIETMQRMHDSI